MALHCYSSLIIPAAVLFFGSSPTLCHAAELILDSVVASVNGEPITTSDVQARLNRKEPLSLQELKRSGKLQETLDAMIAEQVLEAEAARRHISVSDEQLNDYTLQVAENNGLTLQEFEEALRGESKSLEDFRRSIRLQTLRTRLASQLKDLNSGVSEKEVEEYITAHPELTPDKASVTLRQILISFETLRESEARSEAEKLVKILRSDAPPPFAKLAREKSDGPGAVEGGMLGTIALDDLSPLIRQAIEDLDAGDISKPIRSESGYHLFQVVSRAGGNSENVGLKNEVRDILRQQKLHSALEKYFAEELFELYAVEKKI